MSSCARSARTAPSRKATPPRSSARCASPPPRCCCSSRIGEQFDAIVTGASPQGNLGAHLASARRGPPGEGLRGAGRRRRGARAADPHRRAARLHRFRAQSVSAVSARCAARKPRAASVGTSAVIERHPPHERRKMPTPCCVRSIDLYSFRPAAELPAHGGRRTWKSAASARRSCGDISRDEASRPGRGACGQGGESIVKRVRRSALINTQVSN